MSDVRWIKLYAKYKTSSVYKDTHAKNLLNHLLLSAQWKSGQYRTFFRGKEILLDKGQVVIGRYRVAEELGERPSNIRNALKRLKCKYGILDYEADNERTIVTILNWDTYQKIDKKEDYDEDNERTASGQRMDTKQEGKKVRRKEVKIKSTAASLESNKTIKSELANKNEHIVDSEANKHHMKELVKKVLKKKDVKNIIGLGIHIARND